MVWSPSWTTGAKLAEPDRSEVFAAHGRAGHLGLPGMRERAELVDGKLAVWSELNSGHSGRDNPCFRCLYKRVCCAPADILRKRA